jgi:CxxC motif-containing protein
VSRSKYPNCRGKSQNPHVEIYESLKLSQKNQYFIVELIHHPKRQIKSVIKYKSGKQQQVLKIKVKVIEKNKIKSAKQLF